MPSKRMSSACVDYVPALCTHRPSLLPIEWLGEAFGLAQGGRQRPPRAGKLVKPASFRGSKSRNKVSVGEPAEGSLQVTPGLTTGMFITLCCPTLLPPGRPCLRAGAPGGHFKLLRNFAV